MHVHDHGHHDCDVKSYEARADDVIIVVNDATNIVYGTVIVLAFDVFASPPSSPSSESRRRWYGDIVTGIRSWRS
jgi:hypothetical protein